MAFSLGSVLMSIDDAERWQAVEARVDALSSAVKSILTTLVLRGLLNKADLGVLLKETEVLMRQENRHPAALAELRGIEQEMPTYLRAAVGPPPDPDDDDH